MRRLSEATLHAVPAEVECPAYNRRAMRTGVVHLGVGAFHRAHQAVAFDRALAGGDPRWGIVGASLRSASARDALVPQDGLYTVVERDEAGERLRVIGALRDVLVAPDSPARLVETMASPDVHLVTLTITEKGYAVDAATGELDRNEPSVAADLASLSNPRTAAGFIAAALAARRRIALAPFTAISCDNLSGNGKQLRAAVLAIAEAHDPELACWIEAEGAFPNTMVDRIVPATTPADIAASAARLGVVDQGVVNTEPFSQWVIEDRFCGPVPDWNALGVSVVADVAPWETAKLRLLNAAHSAMAYLGGSAGLEFVHEFVSLPKGRRYLDALWDEMDATVPPCPGLDLAEYRAALLRRFGNPRLAHRLDQIAADGSKKLPQRLIAPVAWRLDRGERADALLLAIGGWMRWLDGRDELGRPFLVEDPVGPALQHAIRAASTGEEAAARLLAMHPMSDLAEHAAELIPLLGLNLDHLRGSTRERLAGV